MSPGFFFFLLLLSQIIQWIKKKEITQINVFLNSINLVVVSFSMEDESNQKRKENCSG